MSRFLPTPISILYYKLYWVFRGFFGVPSGSCQHDVFAVGFGDYCDWDFRGVSVNYGLDGSQEFSRNLIFFHSNLTVFLGNCEPPPATTLKKFWTLPSLSTQEKSPPTDISKNPSIKLKFQKSNKSSMQQKRNSFVI